MGTIGSAQALFEADTSGFTASLKSASASLGQVGEQATAAGQKVDAATRVQEAAARRVQRAMAQVATEQKSLAGEEVTAGALKVAQATKMQADAYAQLRRVQGLAKSGYVEEATSLSLLAAAEVRLGEAATGVAEAKQREAAASEAASVKEALAAQKVTAEAMRTAAALREQAEAQSLLARAQAISRSAIAVEGADPIALVAAAQLRATAAAAEVAAAKKAEAVAVAEAAEEEALSQNVIVRAFQRVALVARESLDSIKERLISTAETAGVEGVGIEGAFAGIGKLFGAGIALGFAANYVDGLAKMNVELDHLATKTGIDIQQLAGLQQIVKEMGGEWDPVTIGLVRMQRAQVLAVEGSKNASNAQVKAFADIGISVQELEHMNPEQLFVRVAGAINSIQQPAVATAAAMGIFGRGGAALIPIFKEQGAVLEENMTKTGKMTGITDESAAAARRWTEDVARLSAQFRSVMIPVMEHAEDVVKGIGGAFMAAFTAVDAVLETAAASIVSLVVGIGGLAKALYDVSKGDYIGATQDVTGTKDKIVEVYKDAFADIAREGRKTWDLFTKQTPAPPRTEGGGGDTDLSGLVWPHGDEAAKAARLQMEAFEHGADELKMAGEGDVFHERAYWASKLATLQEGSANYNRVYAKVAEATKAMDEELERSLHVHKAAGDDGFLKEQEHQADEQARRVAEIRQNAADAQAKQQEKAQLSDVSIALTHGEISKYQALVAEAQIHAAAFGAEIAVVEKRLAEAEAMRDLPGMQEEIAKRQAQLAQLKAQADEQRQQDVSKIDSQTPGGALSDAFHEWAQQATDAAALVRKAFAEAVTGINDSLAGAITAQARTGEDRLRNLRNGLAGVGRSVANQGIQFGLGKLESSLPGDLGKLLGAGKKPTGTKGDPLYVAFAAAPETAKAAALPVFPALPAFLGGGSSIPQEVRGPAAEGSRLLSPLLGRPAASSGSPFSAAALDSGRFIDSLFSKPNGAPASASGNSGSDVTGSSEVPTSNYLDALATLAPGAGTAGGSNAFFDSNSSGYTAADLSMMQPDDSGSLDYGGNAAPAQQPITSITQKPKGGVGNIVSSLTSTALHLIPGFESGGPIAPDMGAFMVGEAGPEILNIGSASGHVTPNSQLQNFGGDTHFHDNRTIDARGSTDVAATKAMIDRALTKSTPATIAMAVSAVSDYRRRMPSTRR
jgi:hypothetical protein